MAWSKWVSLGLFQPYQRSYGPLLITGEGAHFVVLIVEQTKYRQKTRPKWQKISKHDFQFSVCCGLPRNWFQQNSPGFDMLLGEIPPKLFPLRLGWLTSCLCGWQLAIWSTDTFTKTIPRDFWAAQISFSRNKNICLYIFLARLLRYYGILLGCKHKLVIFIVFWNCDFIHSIKCTFVLWKVILDCRVDAGC